jgi:hypothetical protein
LPVVSYQSLDFRIFQVYRKLKRAADQSKVCRKRTISTGSGRSA